MKKGRILRLMFILAVTTIMIAATAVVASAATVNKNDADYKYSKVHSYRNSWQEAKRCQGYSVDNNCSGNFLI